MHEDICDFFLYYCGNLGRYKIFNILEWMLQQKNYQEISWKVRKIVNCFICLAKRLNAINAL